MGEYSIGSGYYRIGNNAESFVLYDFLRPTSHEPVLPTARSNTTWSRFPYAMELACSLLGSSQLGTVGWYGLVS